MDAESPSAMAQRKYTPMLLYGFQVSATEAIG